MKTKQESFSFFKPLLSWLKLYGLPLLLFVLSVLLLGPNVWASESPNGDQQETYFNEAAKQAFRDQVSDEDKPYLVDVGSRLILPGPDKPVKFVAGRSIVYLQFQQPLTSQQRGELIRAGVRFYASVSPYTYLAKIKRTALTTLRQHPLRRGLEMVIPPDRLTKGLYHGTVGDHVINPDGTWSVYVRFYEEVKLTQALRVLDELGILVTDRSRMLFNNRLLVKATQEQIEALAESSLVRYIKEIPAPPMDDNVVAAQISNVDDIQGAPFNLDGNGIRVGQWESGHARTTHVDLTPRVNVIQSGAGVSNHGTHVAGTIMGTGSGNAAALGMAPGLDGIFSYDSGGNTADEQADAIADYGILISNHSWGPVTGWYYDDSDDTWKDMGNEDQFGNYDGLAADYDALVRGTGLIISKSSGNDRNDCDGGADPSLPGSDCDGALGADGERYDNTDTFDIAKNVISVGAINDDATTITSFSSAGPADDGRIKPDIVANGSWLTSTCSGSDTDYCQLQGTSMSTPTVSGTVALLIQRYREKYEGHNPSPDVIKALLVNTAIDVGRAGPDYLFGHGLMDALAAVNTIDIGAVRILTEAVDQGETDEYYLTVTGDQGELRVTLNWLDPEGATDSGDPDIVHNLDLALIAPDDSIHYPFTGPGGSYTNLATNTGPNNIDTVEHARVNPMQGIWKVRVTGSAVGSGPQNYAIVANASFILDDQPDMRVSAALDFNETCSGDWEDRPVSIFNIGGADLLVHSVSVTAGEADFTVLPDPTQPFIVRPGDHVDVWVRFSPSSPGLKAGTLTIFSNDPDEPEYLIDMTGEGGVGDVDAILEADGEFGDVPLGEFKVLNLQVINEGSCNLELTNVSRISGSTDFSIGEVIEFPIILHAGDHVDIPLRFEPTLPYEAKAATFRVETDDPDESIIDFEVTGTCPPPDIHITGSLEFGIVCADVLAEKVINICNNGFSNLDVSEVAFDPPCDDFEIINNPFPAIVSPDFCVPVTVQYAPTEAGAHACILKITSNDPDTPVVTVDVTATTPIPIIGIAPDQAFPPTVVQTVGDCMSLNPFPISNNGVCNSTIMDVSITTNEGDFSLMGLPELPIPLQPGHELGEGDLNVVFTPEVMIPWWTGRFHEGELTVTYISDPVTGASTSVVRDLCGEGVFTGARVLVTVDGDPVDEVIRIKLLRLTGNKNKKRLDTVDVAKDLILQTITPPPPCTPFQYHREYGTVSNPIQLAPGSYQVTATAMVNGKRKTKTVGFDVSTCDFNPNVVIDF